MAPPRKRASARPTRGIRRAGAISYATPPFRKMLVANRGEIAVRVIRACHEMGIATVAVYSEADRDALHVRCASEAISIGPPPAAESYLRIDRILDAAKKSGADSIHPGYGFLAENPALAEACRAAGVVFIGPTPASMEAMGDKVRARRLMNGAGVPVVRGTSALPRETAEVVRLAGSIGYPVLLKAAAGGGGKGMRVVRGERELDSLLPQARGEALAAFGDDTLFLEKYVERPRHIEVQVLADAHGNCIHLGERECSIQRRHQKLIEECPSPIVDEATRRRLGRMAIQAARAAKYVSAGTVEFLRGADGSFYFMEMNTRLQVEHPVTEMTVGIDLVKAMIEIAAGRPLTLRQDDVVIRGHAIECRILAEDPSRNFVPAPGTIRGLRTPAGPGIRDDGGTYAGYTVPVHYDALLSKLIAWGRDRGEAIQRMARALQEYRITGLCTTIGFHRKVMEHPAFLEGELHTGFLGEHPELLRPVHDPRLDEVAIVAAAIAHFRGMGAAPTASDTDSRGASSAWKWSGRRGWRR